MRSEITTIIFSKNRACQLELLLRTLDFPATIIYTCDPEYQAGYDILFREHPSYTYVKETDFRKQFLELVGGAKEYILFLVDDDIQLIPTPDVLPEFEEFKRSPELICLSLRLSPFLRGAPVMENKRWNWRKLRRSWGYPMSLSAHIFRTADIFPILQAHEFDIPNDVEVVFRSYPPDKDIMYCVDEPFFVNIPANQVQTKYPFKDLHITTRFLEDQYLAGKRISFEALKKTANKADNCFLRTTYQFN
jgi:hypothetical protein